VKLAGISFILAKTGLGVILFIAPDVVITGGISNIY